MNDMIRGIKINPGYKKTPVGIIPEDWEVKKLEEVCKLKSGGTPSRKKKDYWNGNIPWITTSLVNFNTISKTEEHITKKGLENSSAQLFPLGTTIMAIYGQGLTRGKVAKLGITAATNQACVAFLNKDGDFQRFLFYALSFHYRKLRNISNDGSQKNLSSTLLKNYRIAFPKGKEQKAIADCLSTWDLGIEKLTALIDAKKEQKKGLMQRLLTGSLRLRSATGEPFDGEWKEVRLGDIAYITTGASNKQDASDDFEYVFFDRSSDVLTSKIFLYDCEAIIVPGEGADFIPKYFVGKFDLHQRAYAIMNFKNVLGKYIFYYLMNDRKHLLRQAVGSTVKSLRLPYFKSMPMKIPSFEEQTAIAEVLMTADKEIELLEQKLQAMKEQKKGLMQVLLTGEKRLGVKN